MSNDELERRIDILEQDVEALTAALRTVLDWKYKPSELRNVQKQFDGLSIRVEGREQTEEILDRLPR